MICIYDNNFETFWQILNNLGKHLNVWKKDFFDFVFNNKKIIWLILPFYLKITRNVLHFKSLNFFWNSKDVSFFLPFSFLLLKKLAHQRISLKIVFFIYNRLSVHSEYYNNYTILFNSYSSGPIRCKFV